MPPNARPNSSAPVGSSCAATVTTPRSLATGNAHASPSGSARGLSALRTVYGLPAMLPNLSIAAGGTRSHGSFSKRLLSPPLGRGAGASRGPLPELSGSPPLHAQRLASTKPATDLNTIRTDASPHSLNLGSDPRKSP